VRVKKKGTWIKSKQEVAVRARVKLRGELRRETYKKDGKEQRGGETAEENLLFRRAKRF